MWKPRAVTAPVLAALALLGATLAAPACTTLRPDRCGADAAGDPTSERDEVLVKHLLRALLTDDFKAFQRLQPTESQYVTLAWRFGASQADDMMSVIRDPAPAEASFQATRAMLGAAGLDVRTAPRCTRKVAAREDEPRFYTLDVAIGHATDAKHLTVNVFDSGGRASLVGPLEGPGLGLSLARLLDLMEGFVAAVEGAAERPAQVAAAKAYTAAHGQEYHLLKDELVRLVSADPSKVVKHLAQIQLRSQAVQERLEKLTGSLTVDDPLHAAVLEFFGTDFGGASDEPKPDPMEPPLVPEGPFIPESRNPVTQPPELQPTPND